MKNHFLLFVLIIISQSVSAQSSTRPTQRPIVVNTKNLQVTVNANTLRWSAQIKGTAMQINDIHFLKDDPAGWKITSTVINNDVNKLGSYTTIKLHGTKAGQLDFDYQISASKTNNDLIVSLGEANHTKKNINITDLDYFISDDAQIGGATSNWVTLGTYDRNRSLYELNAVINLITPKLYEVNHVVRDSTTGNSLLMGHITTFKGRSRFEVASGWAGKTNDRMQVRGYCSYKVTIPPGKSFEGEKLLIDFNTDGLRSMEHQADLIAIAHDIRLKERRPINLDDKELVANNYTRYHGWMSGGTNASAKKFFQDNGLVDFYWGLGGPGQQGTFGVYGMGGSTQGRPSRANYPAETFLPIRTVKYDGERVIDFSNPLAVKLETERANKWVVGHEKETGRAEMDFADWWDKWPGQFDPFMSAAETYRAGGMPWRNVIDKSAPRRIVRSNMNAIDLSYGIVDVTRISEDADQGYEDGESFMVGKEFTGLFTESVLGSANRFFYNGRVFWNDGDGFHIYKYKAPDGKLFNYGQAKVDANFHAFAGSTLFLSEALDTEYPADRIELLKRISPTTMDVSYPVDLFVRKPARVWNMPVERSFGKWDVLAVFNYTSKGTSKPFSTKLDAARDLRLDPNKEYIVYEFWTKKLIGTFKGTFVTRPLSPYDCDIYSIVEKQDHPVLISTSRHIRQMAVDIKNMAYDQQQRTLSGTSRQVKNDSYQLRIYLPQGYTAKNVELSGGNTSTMKTEGDLLLVDFTPTTGDDVNWKVSFK